MKKAKIISKLSQDTTKKLGRYNKERKALNWFGWALRIIQRRNKPCFSDNNCAYGNKHLVREVMKVGNGTAFRSAACSGCKQGIEVLSALATEKALAQDKVDEHLKTLHPGCVILEQCWLISPKSLKVGDTTVLAAIKTLDKSKRLDNILVKTYKI